MEPTLNTLAVVLDQPRSLSLRELTLASPGAEDVVVEVAWTGISTGTERLLWSGEMPPFPGLGYPLVPGYEAVGEVVSAGPASGRTVGEMVFVPGANCFTEARGLFGATAQRLVVPGARTVPIAAGVGEAGCLMALAATAYHALVPEAGTPLPDLIVGHGALGRLLGRLVQALGDGASPTVWEVNPARMDGDTGYPVLHPDQDPRRDYRCICDVSGNAGLVDDLVGRLAPGGEVVLAGFYDRISFAFPAAFLKEARFRVAAEWKPRDLAATAALVADGTLSLEGLITHRREARGAPEAYQTAFGDPTCVKMILDWRNSS